MKLGRARRAEAIAGIAVFLMLGLLSGIRSGLAQEVVSGCGVITEDTVWNAQSLYVLNGCAVTIEAGAALTVEPGTIIKVAGFHDKVIVNGRLDLAGSAAAPVVVTSLRDDSHGGDTNGDGAASAPAPGDWGWVTFNPGSGGTIEHAVVSYGGVGSHGYTVWASVRVYGPSQVSLDHATLWASYSHGFYAENATVSVTNSRIGDSGAGGNYGLNFEGLSPDSALLLADNEFTTPAGASAVRVRLSDHPGRIEILGNTASGVGRNGLVLEGTVRRDLTLDADGGLPLVVATSFSVGAEATLTVSPGAVFKSTGCGGKIFVDGALVASGTAENPVVFTSLADDGYGNDTNGNGAATVPAAGDWGYVRVNAGGEGVFDHAVFRYGGVACTGYDVWAMLQAVEASLEVERTTFESSYFDALSSNASQVRVHHSSFADSSPDFAKAVNKIGGQLPVDARYNWWGDASGPYHASKNSAGLGDDVSDGVLFLPWAINAAGQLATQVLVGGPTRVSPGETVDYAVSFFAGQDIDDAVLKVELPPGSEYAGSDGTLWARNREVFWPLGDLVAESEGVKSLRVRYPWGLPDSQRVSRGLLDGSTLDAGDYEFDTSPYYEYASPPADDLQPLSRTEIGALIAQRPDIAALVDEAVDAGLKLVGGAQRQSSPGGLSREAFLVGAGETRRISWDAEGLLEMRMKPEAVVLSDGTGTLTVDSGTGAVSYGGDWRDETTAATFGTEPVEESFGHGACLNNCFVQGGLSLIESGALGRQAVHPRLLTQEVLGARLWPILTSKECGTVCVRFDECGPCLSALLDSAEKFPEIDSLLTRCHKGCKNDDIRHTGRCDWDPLYPLPPKPEPKPIIVCGYGQELAGMGIVVLRCDRETGAWREESGRAFHCSCFLGDKKNWCRQSGTTAQCVEVDPRYGGECGTPRIPANPQVGYERDCTPESFTGYWGTPLPGASATAGALLQAVPGQRACSEMTTRVRPPRDPNEKTGATGDVLPGELLTYTVFFENVGAGNALGVYVVDDLSPHLDETTLDLAGGGEFYPITRSILWDVGDLAPKGEEGSKGERTFTIRARDDLQSGTVISNQAVVYFPSVPEETATNSVVNLVQPLVAHAQRLETDFATPIEIVLSGADVSGAPPSFSVVAIPTNGSLSGVAPQLTYTPADNFTGQDRFSFVVENDVSTSRPADVVITVSPSSADSVAPEVVWTYPPDGAVLYDLSAAPLANDDEGALYAPSLAVGFSEAMAAATIDTVSMRVTDAGGTSLPALVTWDGVANRAVLTPRVAWAEGRYTATVTSAVRDASGNPLSQDHSWSFRVGSSSASCAGDCNGDGQVAINELIRGVNIALGFAPIEQCPSFDGNGDGQVAINELIRAVNNALNGC